MQNFDAFLYVLAMCNLLSITLISAVAMHILANKYTLLQAVTPALALQSVCTLHHKGLTLLPPLFILFCCFCVVSGMCCVHV